MKRISLAGTDLLNRWLFQQGRVNLLHSMAFVAVAFAYLLNHAGPFSPVCRRGCGMFAVLQSAIVWWPVVASWIIVQHPNETPVAFRWWQGLFALINSAAAYVYATTDVHSLSFASIAVCSLMHAGLLALIAPLAIERWDPPTGPAL